MIRPLWVRTTRLAINPPSPRPDAEPPPQAEALLVGRAWAFHVRHRVVYNTIFDREVLARIAAARRDGRANCAGTHHGINSSSEPERGNEVVDLSHTTGRASGFFV